MTTPAAWVEAWRGIPSRAIAVSISSVDPLIPHKVFQRIRELKVPLL
jgi:hypothetical protein